MNMDMDVSPSPPNERIPPPMPSNADLSENGDGGGQIPSPALRQEVWRELVQRYTALQLYDTARFYAERAWYDLPCQEHAFQLAQVYYQQGKVKQSYLILQDCKHGDHRPSKYLLALCCVSLQKYEEAEAILSPKQRFHANETGLELSEEALQAMPGGAAGLLLLGKLCRRQQRHELAVTYFRYALELDPFLWSAVSELCELGLSDNLRDHLCNFFHQRHPAPLVDPAGCEGDGDDLSASVDASQSDVRPRTAPPTTTAAAAQAALNVSTGSRDASSSKALGASYASLSFAQQSASKDYSLPPWSLQASDLYAQTPTSLGGGGGLSALHNSYSASQHSHSQFALHQMTMDGSQLTPIAVSSAKVVRRLLGDASVEYSAEKASQLALSAISQLSQSRHHLAPPHFTPSTDAPGTAASAPSSAGGASMASPSKLMTPSGIHAADVSALSMHIPFQTPGSMPFSPITRSMLDEDDDLYAPSLGHAANVSSFSLASQQSKPANRSQLAQNTSLGFELGLSRIDEASTPGLATSIDASSSALAPLRSQLFGQPTPDDVDRSLHASMPPLPPSHAAQAPAPFPQTQAGGRRRVSFGPSTRLSFSEAALPSDAHLPPAGSGAGSTNKVVTAGGSGDERQPSKLLRSSDPADAATAKATDAGPAVSQPPSSSGSGRRGGSRGRSSSAHGLYLARRFALEHVVSVLAEANQHLAHYCGLECIRVLQEQLPAPHFASALVSSFLGRAYIDMNEYGAAVLAFKEMMRLEPFRLAGLEFLSSALWHQRKEHELASLAQQVVEIDRLAPETWCVLGNCASLQKEAETALRFFQRATQVDPHFTYAYTLAGHEFVANEDMEKAIAAFRTALCCNVRHYNAWYGLGSIYYRQERYELAEYHFREARAINQRSSVLDCYLAMALNAQGTAAKVREALQILADASQRFEHNPQLRFQRAHILMMQDQWAEALDELLLVEKHVPKEPSVHALLGQIYQRLGDVQKSLLHLNIAIDLDPKEANSIKAIMDNFEEMGIEI